MEGAEKPSSAGDIAPGSGNWVKHKKGETEVSLNPLNPASLAEVAPHLSEEKSGLFRVRAINGGAIRIICVRWQKPVFLQINGYSESGISCGRIWCK
jgi:hypothetical protein